MIHLKLTNGMELSYDDYDFIKIYKDNLFQSIPAINLKRKDILVHYYNKYENTNTNELNKQEIFVFEKIISSYFLENEIFTLTIKEEEFKTFKKFLNIISLKKENNKNTITFKNSKITNINILLTNILKGKKILSENFESSLINLNGLMSFILKNATYSKKNNIILKYKDFILKELQLILLKFKIKSDLIDSTLIISNKFSLSKLLYNFNYNNSCKNLKQIVSNLEKELLYATENEIYYKIQIKETKSSF